MSAAGGALVRLERILTMVPWLLEHPGVSIEEVSERFSVPREELAEDLDILGYCGLPGYGGGDLVEVSVVGERIVVRMAHFFSRPLTLSLREGVTLLLAARALSSVEGVSESTALRRAVGKLERALGAGAASFTVDLRSDGDQWLPRAREAVESGRIVRLVYRSASKAETTQRDVEPWAVVSSGGAWYLQAYCHLATGPRDFRLDRIKDLTLLDAVRTLPVPEAIDPPIYRPEPDDHAVTLDLARSAWWVPEWIVVDSVKQRGSRRRIVFRTPDLEWAARVVLQLGGAAVVVDPPAVKERVAQLAAQTLAAYAEA